MISLSGKEKHGRLNMNMVSNLNNVE